MCCGLGEEERTKFRKKKKEKKETLSRPKVGWLGSVADLENFGGGDFKHKTSKIRMSSPRLKVIFRPKSEIQRFFSPKIRWSPKKKRSSPILRMIFRPKSFA